MANSEKLIRLLKIISLLENRNGASLNDLAEECSVCERTIYRDIEAINLSGMPVFFDPQSKRYRFAEKVFLKPLTFAIDEATAVSQCIQGFLKDPHPLRQPLQCALERILATLPAERQKQVDKLRCSIDITVAQYPHSVRTDIFSCVERAIHEQRRLHLKYYTKSSETVLERDVDPYLITFRGKAWYLVGFCHLRSEVKIFRVDRIMDIEILQTRFLLPRKFSVEDYFGGSWLIEQGDPLRVKLRFNPEEARWVREEIFHHSQQIREESDGSLLFEVTVNGSREITRWILGFGPGVEVLEPESLRKHIGELVMQSHKLYQST